MPIKLGELLLNENIISPQQLDAALSHQKMRGGSLGRVLVSLGLVRDEEITGLLSRRYGVPSIDLDHVDVDPAIIRIIPVETARKYKVLPLCRTGVTLRIAMADPINVFAMNDIQFMTGYNLETRVASESALEDAIDRYYESMPPWKRAARAQTKDSVRQVIGQARPPAKRCAELRAVWQDGSYWVGEVRENESLGLHVSWCWGRGAECEYGGRGDANDIAVSVAEGVDFLGEIRAAEVERRMPILGPPTTLEAAFVKSGDP